MERKEFDTLMRHLQALYSGFYVDEEEWWEVLNKYSYKEIKNRIDKRKSITPPVHTNLIRGLEEEVIKPIILKCEFCGKKENVLDMNEWLKKHERCKSVDFLYRYIKKVKGEEITKEIYYEMNADEFEQAYRPWMNHYLTHRESNFIKKI